MKTEYQKGNHSLINKVVHKPSNDRSYVVNFLDYAKSNHKFSYKEQPVIEYIIDGDYAVCSSDKQGCFFCIVKDDEYFCDNFTNLGVVLGQEFNFWERQGLSVTEHNALKESLLNQKFKNLHTNISEYKEYQFGTQVNIWFSMNEYWHWFNEEIPKIEFIRKNNYPILVNKLRHWQLESLKRFPDILDRLIEIDTPCKIRALSYRAFSSPSTSYRGKTSAWVSHFLNKNFSPTFNLAPTNKIYISRNDSSARCVENEEELLKLLSDKGYTIYKDFSKRSLQEKLDIFRTSKIVISPTGSSLTHCHAMANGTFVLDFNHSFQLEEECAWNNIGVELGVNWYSFPAATGSIGPRSLNGIIKKNNNLQVDVDKFKKYVVYLEKELGNGKTSNI